MPLTALYILSVITLMVAAGVGFGFYLMRTSKKQSEYQKRVQALENELILLRSQAGKKAKEISDVQKNTVLEHYAAIVIDQMDRAVILIDPKGIVRLMNAAAQRLLDLSAGVGMSYKDVVHIHVVGQPDNYALFDQAFGGKTVILPDNMELVSQHGAFPLNGSIIPLMNGQTVEGIMFLFADNSAAIAKMKEEQAFFSATAHELRAPLTVIRMTVSLLKDKFDSMPRDKVAEHLRRTDETTERLVRLVNEFLNVSRIDQGRLEVKRDRFDIVALTDEVIGEYSVLAKERKLYIHHEKDIEQRTVVGDRAKASEVLSNLVSNGLKYTVQGGLTISYKVVDSTLNTIVADTGSGIPEESKRLLFSRFGQVGSGATPGKSIGLGLYISKKFAQLMHGDVILEESVPGKGSRFVFQLPLG